MSQIRLTTRYRNQLRRTQEGWTIETLVWQWLPDRWARLWRMLEPVYFRPLPSQRGILVNIQAPKGY